MMRCRELDAEVGPADARMAAYFSGDHHPREALPARIGFVAIVAGTPIAYAAGHLTRRYGCQGEIQYLYVAPMYRRRGVARQLVQLLAQWFVEQHAGHVCVDVNEQSSGARPFYTSIGARTLRPHWMHWPDISVVLEPHQP